MTRGEGAWRLAPVKVNLTLHVGAVRSDGYHPVSSLCFFPAIGDRVALGPVADNFSLEVAGPLAHELSDVPPERNLALRAARLLADVSAVRPRVLRLDKRVPAAAGIAGGTADAAAVLSLLNADSQQPLRPEALRRLSRALGADGPVCVAGQEAEGGVWLAEGDGDRVSRAGAAPPLWCVLANPGTAVPTGQVFRLFDAAPPPGPLAQPAGLVRTTQGLIERAERGRNDLRSAALALAPEVAAVEDALAAAPGCRFARMSGSGATVFALFSSAAAAARAARRQRAGGRWCAAAPVLTGARTA